MLIALITVIHVIVCVTLIIVVLLQHGKSADIAATFGGAGSQTAFGPRGTATLLSKVTTVAAVVFMLTSISLTIFATRNHPASIMDNMKNPTGSPTQPQK
jgi:preprotein translocase subunit SecG